MMQEIHEQYYNSTDKFSSEKHKFWVAAGISSYGDSNNTQVEDPEIGELKFYIKSWGVYDDDDKITFKEVNTTMCNKTTDFNDLDAELHLEFESFLEVAHNLSLSPSATSIFFSSSIYYFTYTIRKI